MRNTQKTARTDLAGRWAAVQARSALLFSRAFEAPRLLRRRDGQTTIEYLMILAFVAGMFSIMAIFFHRRILGGLFTIVGLAIGAGTPK